VTYNTNSDDASATTSINPGSDSGCYSEAPSGEYYANFASSFVGKSSFGQWDLTIFDGFSQDEGFVNSWELTLISVPAPATLFLSMAGLGLVLATRRRPQYINK
jgi:hypothetical protein